MAYATVAQMEVRFGEAELAQLSDPEGLTIIPATVEKALSDAAGLIDSYLGRRYPLPLAQVPDAVVTVCQDMALYNLLTLRRRGDIEDARTRYEDALAWLKDIATGRATLGEGFLPPQPGGMVQLTSSPRLFSREGLRGF